MVGIVIVAHGKLPGVFIETTNLIIGGNMDCVSAVSIDPKDENNVVSDRITEAIHDVSDGDGVIIFTDMFGGTPSNIALSFLEEGKVEVISGVNLPMLLHVATHREGVSLSELVLSLQQAGRENISLASEIMRGNDN